MYLNYSLKDALDYTFEFLDNLNLFITKTEPWNLMKDKAKIEEVRQILYVTLE
jgi:methionyl-tRNA synthetase